MAHTNECCTNLLYLTPTNGQSGCHASCLQSKRCHRSSPVSPHLSCCTCRSIVGNGCVKGRVGEPRAHSLKPHSVCEGVEDTLKAGVSACSGGFGAGPAVTKKRYGRGVQVRVFQLGQKVLFLLPTSKNKLLARWQELLEAGAGELFHVNLLPAGIQDEEVRVAYGEEWKLVFKGWSVMDRRHPRG